VLSGISTREAMAYVLSPRREPPPKAGLLLASVDCVARAIPQGLAAPDPSGFRNPRMRALAEALSDMAANRLIGGGIRLTPSGPQTPTTGSGSSP